MNIKTSPTGYVSSQDLSVQNIDFETLHALSTYGEVIDVDNILEHTDFDNPPDEAEQAIINLCKRARSQGIQTLILDTE